MAQNCNCPINSNNTQQRDHDLSCVQRKITWNDLFPRLVPEEEGDVFDETSDNYCRNFLVKEEGYLNPEDLLQIPEDLIKELPNPPIKGAVKNRIITFKRRCGQRFSDPSTRNQPPTNQG
eukprot:TRINITY_DN426_c0_g1_i8.p1 TRINITY_DN426_c0_g1~~TRINITY_DN426_c0_g1_i8.p1  ORF type:complete len:120 (-),score=16.85 TRINITY_DN426_c0_g1_i8:92-451(-)